MYQFASANPQPPATLPTPAPGNHKPALCASVCVCRRRIEILFQLGSPPYVRASFCGRGCTSLTQGPQPWCVGAPPQGLRLSTATSLRARGRCPSGSTLGPAGRTAHQSREQDPSPGLGGALSLGRAWRTQPSPATCPSCSRENQPRDGEPR